MKIMDAHAHLMDEMYQNDVQEVIARCQENDIECLVNIGFDKESSYQAVELAEKYSWMYAAIGLHPDACNEEEADITFLRELSKSQKVVAIGEIGLDYHYLEKEESSLQATKSNQQKHFIRQIQLANELSLPVAIHSRDADMDMLRILKENAIHKRICDALLFFECRNSQRGAKARWLHFSCRHSYF